jgi:transposase
LNGVLRLLKKGETAMTLYIGVDFHPYQQTVCWINRETGELRTQNLRHNRDELDRFYSSFPPATIGVEASSKMNWFEDLIFDKGHKLLVGNPVLIRKRATSRHKNDKRDAENILTLLMNNEFPTLWRRSRESDRLLEVLRLRRSLVRQRTQVCNRLQSMAHEIGLIRGRMRTQRFREQLESTEMDDVRQLRRRSLLALLDELEKRVAELERWLKDWADGDEQAQLLLTQTGVGYLTALAMVHTIGDVGRFTSMRQVTAFVGLDPLEKSSSTRIRFGHVSKAGSSLLRQLLVHSAHIAVRRDIRLKSFYRRLVKKKAKAVAKTAAARKLLVKLAIMLRDSITADEFDTRGSATVDDARETRGH